MTRLAVTSLCEFAARRGDLDYRYTPAPTALEGIEGHARLRRRREPTYRSEYRVEGGCGSLQLSGRADGYDPEAGLLEEIKTHRGEVSRIPDAQRSLHRAQLHAYGALLCRAEGIERLSLRLTYYDIGRDREYCEEEDIGADALWSELQELCEAYEGWNEQEKAHREQRDRALAALQFPFSAFRAGQRDLAENVYKTFCTRRTLLLQAPTGIGKTAGTLFPALMAMPREGMDRIFYLTARNTVRQLALEGLQQILDAQPERPPLRVLEFSARLQSCEHPDRACHGESCPLAAGFFDRLPVAREALVQHPGVLDQERLRRIALKFEICPYYLAQEMTRWCDLVVADVNRFFDQSAILHALTRQNGWKAGLLIDEAHNLVERARGMYSAEMAQSRLLSVKRNAPPGLKRMLNRLARCWSKLIADEGLNGAVEKEQRPVLQLQTVPAELCAAAQGTVAGITDYLSEHSADAALQELLFELTGFLKLAESFGDHSLCELSRPGRGKGHLALRNLVPADFLSPRFEQAHAAVLFSATLTPAEYHRDLLGLDGAAHWRNISSPFASAQLVLKLETGISTRLANREASVAPIVELIISQYARHPANYLVYFSSFAYLEQVFARLQARCPDISAWRQIPGMSAAQRQAFIERFVEEGRSIGFAVLGGAFAEGIDLPGSRLSGVFIATLGLPPFDAWHETLRQRLQLRYGRGYEYAYLYPGLQKVAQAGGRVIRTPEDHGLVVLIDDRFSRPEVRALLPDWWPSPVCD